MQSTTTITISDQLDIFFIDGKRPTLEPLVDWSFESHGRIELLSDLRY
jgi:hypothetical protein